MRLFGYYAAHSFWNQVRKLFKTWVLIFIVACGLIGGIIGYSVASIEEASEEYHAGEYEEEYDDDEIEEGISTDDVLSEIMPEGEDLYEWDENGLSVYRDGELQESYPLEGFIEIAVMLATLILFGWQILSADKNGSKIFLMADVNLLFASPMKPQSVLLFRLMCQIGVSLMASLYLLFQIPNLVINLEVSIWFAIALVFGWFFLLLVGKMLQIFFYTLCSTQEKWKKFLTPGVWAVALIFLAGFAGYGLATKQTILSAAFGFFNAPFTRWIPMVGWLKGVLMFAYEENYVMAAVCAALLLVTSILMIWAIWQMKADFYEDAMAKSEETAALMAAASEGVTAANKKRKTGEKLRKNDFNRGWGANVFLYKSLYNRFRFAPLHFLTKTTITYLGVTLSCLLISKIFDTPFTFAFIVMGVGIFVFFRAMGNPLEEDTRMAFFVMIPENTWWKLFWSLMSGTVNCLLDILPALLLGAILTKTNPLLCGGWILFILSIDMYATIVAAFISLSVPESIGKVAKQLIQIMFIYFGLIPDILCIAIGIGLDHFILAAVGASAINLGLSAIFFALTPLFLEPKAGIRPRVAPVTEEVRRQASKAFSQMGTAGAWLIIGASVLQIAVMKIVNASHPEIFQSEIGMFLITFLPIYLVAFPVGFAILHKMPKAVPEKSDWSLLAMLRFLCMSLMLLYAGNIVGILTNTLIGFFVDTPQNPLEGYAGAQSLFLRIFFLVLCAPIIEELFFRKALIDRMRIYGEKTAVITSALMFGLFHGNFSQFFYASGLGLVLGYVYLRSGKSRYNIAIHMFINFIGSIGTLALLEKMEAEAEPGFYTILFVVYMCAIFLSVILGLVLLALRAEKIHYADVEHELAKGQILKTTWCNVGMMLFLAGSIFLFTISILGITFI